MVLWLLGEAEQTAARKGLSLGCEGPLYFWRRLTTSKFNEGFSIRWHGAPTGGAVMTTDDERWESLASEYLRRLAAEDMRQWTRYWRFADRSTGPDGEQQANVNDALSKVERDCRKIVRLTSRQVYFG
jgi:hypothetical protein